VLVLSQKTAVLTLVPIRDPARRLQRGCSKTGDRRAHSSTDVLAGPADYTGWSPETAERRLAFKLYVHYLFFTWVSIYGTV
jgi:hypothetical protein